MKRESQILGEGEGVGDGEGECRYFYLGFTDSLEENTWVSVDTGLPMVGLTWAANQPNNFDNQAVFSTLIGRAPNEARLSLVESFRVLPAILCLAGSL